MKAVKATLELWRDWYIQYLIDLCSENRESLKKAYENVPKSDFVCLGDMGSGGNDYIRIIYTGEKQEV